MNRCTQAEFESLLNYHGGQCVSLYLPTQRGGLDCRRAQVELKNLLAQAVDLLQGRGISAVDARSVLEPIQTLSETATFWKQLSDGLAIFVSSEGVRHYRLPMEFRPEAIVGRRFYLKPLLPLVDRAEHFFVLAVSENSVRFFRGSRWQMVEIPVAGLPESLSQALHYDHPADTRQFHIEMIGHGGHTQSAYHGDGNLRDQGKTEMVAYFRCIDAAIRPLLSGERAPLVFAGVDYLFPLYRHINSYPHLASQHISGNPDRPDHERLRVQALACLADYFEHDHKTALRKYPGLAAKGMASHDLQTVLRAAHEGRVECLLVDATQNCWGRWNERQQSVDLDPVRRPSSDELLDLAVAQTLTHRGVVYPVGREQLPAQAVVAALFRYPDSLPAGDVESAASAASER